ncbi:MAG TPA: RIP metalloprotease [Caulobacteraceae bacterium]|nr:RIP metalloprotease [Caulobacteraceae bacterium]
MMAFLQNAILYVLPFLLVMTVIVTIHELGHFLTARAFGVAIDRFSIGFGRALVAWRDRAGVEWRIGWLPLGGYVRFAGDENAASVPDQNDLESMRADIVAREGAGAERKYLHFKPLWQRALIVAAGPMANFLLSIALFSVFFGVFGEPMTSTRVDSVVPGSAAERAGFLPGDIVTRAGGKALRNFEDLQFYVQFRAGVPIDFMVERAGRTVRLTARPIAAEQSAPGGSQTVGRIGLTARGGKLQRYNPAEAVGMGVTRTWDMAVTTLYYMGRIVTGQVDANQLHGFIGIAHASGDVAKLALSEAHTEKISWLVAAAFFALQVAAGISVSIGVLNLLPIPVLDGGHLLFYAYESVVRRPLAAGIQAMGYRVGLALLVCLMLFATWNDLQLPRVLHLLGSFS